MYKLIITFIFFIIIPIQLFADQNDKRLNYLFDKLVIAKEEQEIHKLTNQIWKIWHEIDDPKMTREFETGVQMMNLGYFKRSIDYFDKVIMKNPNFAEAYKNKGLIFAELKNYNEALNNFSQAYKINPNLDRLLGSLIFSKHCISEWKSFDEVLKDLSDKFLK